MTMRLPRLVLLAALASATSQIPAFADDAKAPASVLAMASGRLAIEGAVRQPLSLNVDELKQFPGDQIVEMTLPGRDTGGPTSRVRGVRLRAVLDRAIILTPDHNTVKKLAIVAAAKDGYKAVFSWSELFNADLGDAVLVVFECDGHPLGPEEGPMTLISGKDIRTGPRHVKWLQSVDVRQIVQ
jgi:DMSO/TMAO reductase YedYZ molybdopterin-dependent catalytic subunit